MRLVNADALEKKLHELALDEWNQGPSTSWSNAYLECEDMVYDAPTIDAVEVVRCKDCRWYENDGYHTNCQIMRFCVEAEDYCSRGERREDADS